jgi:hypothetical protein
MTALVNMAVVAGYEVVQALEREEATTTKKLEILGKHELLESPNAFPPRISQERRQRDKVILRSVCVA